MTERERYEAAMARVNQYPVSVGGTAVTVPVLVVTPFNPKEAT